MPDATRLASIIASSVPTPQSSVSRSRGHALLWLLPILAAIAVFVALRGAASHPSDANRGEQAAKLRLDAPGFDAELSASLLQAATQALHAAEEALDHEMRRPALIRVRKTVAEYPDSERLAFRSWTVAYARPERAELVLAMERLKSDAPDNLESVLVHEMVHVVLGDIELQLNASSSGGLHRHIPRWLHEGLAQVIAGARYLNGDDELLWYRARTKQLLSFSKLTSSFPDDDETLRVAYAQASSFLAWLDVHVGRQTVLAALRSWLAGEAENLDVALADRDRQWSFTRAEGFWAEDLRDYGLLAVLGSSCFNILILLAVPLLGIVLFKRFRREARAGARLDRFEAEEERRREAWLRRERARIEAERAAVYGYGENSIPGEADDLPGVEFDDNDPFGDDPSSDFDDRAP